jgi:hypothetical protein
VTPPNPPCNPQGKTNLRQARQVNVAASVVA